MERRVLDASKVRQWLEGQREAAMRIQKERVQFLLELTPTRALDLYLALWEAGGAARREPSVLLLGMRRCLERWSATGGGFEGRSASSGS